MLGAAWERNEKAWRQEEGNNGVKGENGETQHFSV